jgi:crotonobetainyl-CoA:carnitine CoA-transferase CaiB-like acyl-CoA transferase
VSLGVWPVRSDRSAGTSTPPNPVSDFNYAWQLTNRNKRSIALDLNSSGAKEVLLRLVTVWRRPATPHF